MAALPQDVDIRIQLRPFRQPRTDGIHAYVLRVVLKVLIITDVMVCETLLPNQSSFCPENQGDVPPQNVKTARSGDLEMRLGSELEETPMGPGVARMHGAMKFLSKLFGEGWSVIPALSA